MSLPYRYVYLVAELPFLAGWMLLYALRKDLRRQMRFMSVFVGVTGIFAEWFWWTADWWHPLTLTGTRVGIEDLLLGLSTGGIAAVLYETTFGRRLRAMRPPRKGHIVPMMALMLLTMSACFWGLHLTSFVSTTIALIVGGGAVLLFRPDLLADALWSGILMTAVTLPVYWFMQPLAPGYVDAVWAQAHLSGARFTGIPIEDLIFYFTMGFAVGPFYEYLRGEKPK